MGYLPQPTPPPERSVFMTCPSRYISERTLRDGSKVTLRPSKPEDEPLLIELFKTFSPETMRLRFLRAVKEVDRRTIARFCNADHSREVCIVAEIDERGRRCLIGMANLIVQPDGGSGEISVVVGDPWQNRGLGSAMMEHLVAVGRDMGLKRLFGEFFSENRRIAHICRKMGFEVRQVDEETCIATLNL